jgi:hypothetical protein
LSAAKVSTWAIFSAIAVFFLLGGEVG